MYGSMRITRRTVQAEQHTSMRGGELLIGLRFHGDSPIVSDSAHCLFAHRLVIGGNDDHEAWLQLLRRW